MSKQFNTHEEAAKFMIDNPRVVVVARRGNKFRWNCGGFEVLSSHNKWEYVCYIDQSPYTLHEPEPKKEELPEFSGEFRAAYTEHFGGFQTVENEPYMRALLKEVRRIAKQVADERIEAASVINQIDDEVICFKLKRGES